jgi:hypothetical protein
MSASSDLQLALEQMLSAPGALSAPIPIVQRRTKDLPNDIAAASANHGLCIYVMPPLPKHFIETDGQGPLFADRVEIRIRIVEQPALNRGKADAYDILDEVQIGLHGRLVEGITPIPLQALSSEEVSDEKVRIIDAIFNAVYQLNPGNP